MSRTERKTFKDFMWSIYESSGMRPEDKKTWDRLVKQYGPHPFTHIMQHGEHSSERTKPTNQEQPQRRTSKRRLDFEVREENNLTEMPLMKRSGAIREAKVEKNLSPTEKEDVRNQRAYGSTSLRDRATGIRRTFHAAERGVKKEIPTGNERSEISGRFGTGAEVRRKIRTLKGRKSGRDFSRRVRQELEAERYIKQQNSEFAAKNAENKIVRL